MRIPSTTRDHGKPRRQHAWNRLASVLALAFVVAGFLAPTARADTAAFALAPRDAAVAVDARNIAGLLEGVEPATLRGVVENFVGREALETFDLLSRRSSAARNIPREVFSGRIAFFIAGDSAPDIWMLGFEAQDERCELILKMIGAKMLAPGRFDSFTERLLVRRAGGWLLLTPRLEGAEQALDAAAARIASEDSGQSLLGDPAIQSLLPSEAPVRVFMRHAAPQGGSTAIALARNGTALRASLHGSYDRMPLGLGTGARRLDAALVRAFESDAAFVMANPANGKPGSGDSAWTAMVPEIVPSPAMRTNLAGERLMAIRLSTAHPMPAIALAWRVEDAEQAAVDQEHYIRTLCCGLTRAAEAAAAGAAPASRDAEPPVERVVRCVALGTFLDRYFGEEMRLSQAALSWKTVQTPCGGWQLYATDAEWLARVATRLEHDSCGHDAQATEPVGAVGFCDGPRAAALLRAWKPLSRPGADAELSPGIAAVASAFEQLGRMRFEYRLPNARSLDATVEIELPARLEGEGLRNGKSGREAAAGVTR